ncbi:MAG: ERF family protein [Nostocales cyanobacterium W4_Combined_metabat2_030]|nr:ERF family protein [Nostocales cyanobacterium W4_Combined_metabat2_030]
MNYEKLLEFQKRIGAISKTETNPFFKSKYFDINQLLEEVKPVLSELGLILIQGLSHIDGKPAIKTELYDVDSEELMPLLSSTTPITENNDPQKMGSAISYFRRYAIQTMLCLQAQDDDANLASKPVAPVLKDDVWTMTLKSCKTLSDLQQCWLTIPVNNQTKELIVLKDNLKTNLK